MKITILNECFFNQKHISTLKKYGEVIVYKDTDTEQKSIERLKGADIAIVDQFLVKCNKKVLQSTKKLKLLALNTTSYAYVDIETAKKQGIKVVNILGYSKQSVAEFSIGLMFNLSRKITQANTMMHDKPIELDPGNKEHQQYIGFELKGKTLGIIGLGNIGSTVAKMANALGMNIIAYTRSKMNIPHVKLVTLEELLKRSDIITLHLPLNDITRNLLAKKELKLLKPSALIINTSQSELIDENALSDSIQSHKIAGVALDCGKMISPKSRLYTLNNVILTPSMGSFTKEAFFENMPSEIINNIEAFINKKPMNLVN